MRNNIDYAQIKNLLQDITQTWYYTKAQLANVATSGDYDDLLNKPTIDSNLSTSSTNAVQNQIITNTLNDKANSVHTHTKSQITDFPQLANVATSGSYNDLSNKPNLANVATSGNYNDLLNKPTQQNLSQLGGVVDVRKLETADTGDISTYIVTQNGVQVGNKINIPKDFLVKSATVEVVTTNNNPVSGYNVGDKYLDFVINSKDNSSTPEHLYILANDLINPYTADEITLTLSNNQFAVKNNGIAYNQLSVALQQAIDDISTKSSTGHQHTTSDITNFPSLATVATSGSYNDLSDKPTFDSTLSNTSTNAVQNKVLMNELNNRSYTSHTHSNWQEVYNNKNLVIQYNSAIGLCHAVFSMQYNFTNNDSINYITNIPSPYRPPANMVCFGHPAGKVNISLNATGVLQFQKTTGTGKTPVGGVWVYIGQ